MKLNWNENKGIIYIFWHFISCSKAKRFSWSLLVLNDDVGHGARVWIWQQATDYRFLLKDLFQFSREENFLQGLFRVMFTYEIKMSKCTGRNHLQKKRKKEKYMLITIFLSFNPNRIPTLRQTRY